MVEKYQFFNGLKFTRDEKTGYYLNSTNNIRMHRYVWEYYNGKIPEGYHIHHIDGQKDNNKIDNLIMIRAEEHAKLHGESLTEEEKEWRRKNLKKNAMPKAKEWHSSEEGRKWHKEHYQKYKQQFSNPKNYVCEQCGKTFVSTQTKTKFCSNKCKSAYRRKSGIDNIVKVCQYCGKEFYANKYSKQIYCSKRCSNRAKPRLPQLRRD